MSETEEKINSEVENARLIEENERLVKENKRMESENRQLQSQLEAAKEQEVNMAIEQR